jgi:hypothetical protein
MRRLIPILAVAALTLLAVPAALGAVGYVGKTSQGNDFNLRTDDAGVVERTSYGWDMNCKGGGSLTNGGTVSRFPNAGDKFKSKGSYEATIERRFEGLFRVKIRGERVDENRFKGTFKVKATVTKKKNGDLVARCSTGLVSWTADRATPVEPPVLPRTAQADLRLR